MVGIRHETHVRLSRDRVTRALQARAWSAQELSRRTGISPTTISNCMAGRPISPRTAQRIAHALAETPALDGLAELLSDEVA
jgi:transcriptional regulator with XRE-family HTH domain